MSVHVGIEQSMPMSGGGVPGGWAEGPMAARQRQTTDAVEVQPSCPRRGEHDPFETGPERRQLSRRGRVHPVDDHRENLVARVR